MVLRRCAPDGGLAILHCIILDRFAVVSNWRMGVSYLTSDSARTRYSASGDVSRRANLRRASRDAKAKETAQRRDRLNRVLHQPLEPIVSSDFTSKPRETCYWAEPRVINQDGIFGSLYVTNERIVFISPSLTHSFALDAIVGIERFTEGVRIDLYNATPLAFTCGDNAISVVIQRLKLGYITQVPNDAFPDPQNPSH